MTDDLEAELADLTERLRFGGTQAHCTELRTRIEQVRARIALHERNKVFVHDNDIDD